MQPVDNANYGEIQQEIPNSTPLMRIAMMAHLDGCDLFVSSCQSSDLRAVFYSK